jgi:predicted nucleotidyltransferase component of viral defense system
MTLKVTETLESIKDLPLFENISLSFIGGTALAYYLQHRISEDIDIICSKALPYKEIIPAIESIGGHKLRDENSVALRMAGLFPDEYMLKFDLDGIKLEFFRATTPLQKEILSNTSTIYYNDGKLQIIDVKSIAKLKLIALLLRNKSRDLFDFKIILDKKLLTTSELVYICTQTKKINSLALLYTFIEKKSEPKDDESVYLDENRPINLSFDEIKKETLCALKIY